MELAAQQQSRRQADGHQHQHHRQHGAQLGAGGTDNQGRFGPAALRQCSNNCTVSWAIGQGIAPDLSLQRALGRLTGRQEAPRMLIDVTKRFLHGKRAPSKQGRMSMTYVCSCKARGGADSSMKTWHQKRQQASQH